MVAHNVFKKASEEIGPLLDPRYLTIVFCCVAAEVLIWYFNLFDDLTTRVAVSLLIAIVPLGTKPSKGFWGSKKTLIWLVVFLVLLLLFAAGDKFNWPALEINAATSVLLLPYVWIVWKLTRPHWLLLIGLALALVLVTAYWAGVLIEDGYSLGILLFPMVLALPASIVWIPIARWVLDKAKASKNCRIAGPGMQAMAMAMLFLPAISAAVALPRMFKLDEAWSAVSLAAVGVLLSAVISDPLRRFLVELGNLKSYVDGP